MSWRVRRIRSKEGLALRALRLHALGDAPWAFGSTLAREEAFTDAVWRDRATQGAGGGDAVTYVAEAGGCWIGMATGLADDRDAPNVDLVGMFVEAAARGRGVGAALVEAVAEWARGRGAPRLFLWVTSTNHAAIRLYERCGFKATGKTKPLDHTRSLTELEMVRDL
jgi:GNAT superfamily N-acetyltransferase